MCIRDSLPFPRLSAFGFWCFLLGGVFLCGSIFFNAAPRGGWFMYPPLTSTYQSDIGADIWLLGFSFIEIAAIAAAYCRQHAFGSGASVSLAVFQSRERR